jgi:transposase
MGGNCALDPEAKAWPWPETERRLSHAQRHPLRAENGLYMGRCAPRVRLASDLLATLLRLGQGLHLGAHMARAAEPARCPRPTQLDARLPRRQLRACQKGGSGVGNTKSGKGSKGMVVADGQGLPIGLSVDSAQPHESQLAQATLATVRVPQKRGRPRTRPKELVADKAYDSAEFRQRLRQRGIKPTIPPIERPQRRQPKRGRPIKTGAGYRQRWTVERCFAGMDNCRRLVVRYERSLGHYRAFCLMAIIFWCVSLILK